MDGSRFALTKACEDDVAQAPAADHLSKVYKKEPRT